MFKRLNGRASLVVAAYEGGVALLGWGAAVWLTLRAPDSLPATPTLLFVLLAVALRREGFSVARLVTHSLAGVAVLGALIALGPQAGAWVAGLSTLLSLLRPFRDGRRLSAGARWRLAFFGSGLNVLALLASGALYHGLGGRWAPTTFELADLPPLLGLCLAWFLGDHLAWSARIALEGGREALRHFLRAIRLYSVVVELIPLPLSLVLALTFRVLGVLSYVLMGTFLVGVGEVLRLLNLNLTRARERVADLTTLNAFSRALLASRLDVSELCRLLAEHTAAVADNTHVWVGLFDAQRRQLETALPGAAPEVLPLSDPGFVAWLQEHQAPLLIQDLLREGLPFVTGKPEGDLRSGLFVPLVARQALIGLLVVWSSEPGAYTVEDLSTVVTFANQTAMAIQNARSYEAEQRRARQIATVGEVSRRVAAILGMEELFGGVVKLVREAFGYYDVQLFTIDPISKRIEFQASTSPVLQGRGLSVDPGQGLVGWVAQTGEQLVVNDVTQEPRYRPVDVLEGTRAEAVVPLKVEERLVGILDVQSDRVDAFDEDDLFVLRTLADQIAIAIEDNRLYRAEKTRRRLADTLRETAAALSSTLELRAVLDLVLAQLQRVIRYDAAAILEWRADHYCPVAGTGPKYGAPDRCLTRKEAEQLERLTTEPGPISLSGSTAEAGGEARPSSLAAPLRVKERLIGALILEREGPEGFASEELEVASAFAHQAAVAIENARLYEAEQRRARQLGAIAAVGKRVASILDLDELLVQVVNLVRDEFGYYHVQIFTAESETGALTFRASTNAVTQQQSLSVAAGEGIIGWAAAHGEPLLVNDVSRDPRYRPDEALPDTRSELAVPLRVEDRVVGILDIQSDQVDAFSPEDLSTTLTLADQVAVAIENARLYAAQQEEAWVTTALLQVAETLANLIGIEEVLDAVARLVPLLVGVDRSAIFLRDEDTGRFDAVRVYGPGGSEREAFLARPLDELMPMLRKALQQVTGPLELEADESEAGREARAALGVVSGLALPLRVGGETIGALVAGHVREADRQLHRSRQAILIGIANQAAMAIRNAQLYIAQREEAWVSTAMLQVAELAARTRDLDEILTGLARLTSMLVGVERCCVFLWDRGQHRYLPCQGYGLPDDLRERLHRAGLAEGGFPLLERVRATGEPLAVEANASPELMPPALIEALGMTCVLALPLRSQAEVLGVMLVDCAMPVHRLPARRVSLLSSIASQAAVAIENAQLYRESLQRERMAQELRVARQIQETFLPETCPTVPGWSIAATSRPAREVGGDFYDFIALDSHHLGLVIADVSDKGVPAALFMALSRSVMRAVARMERSPTDTLRQVSDLLLADSRSGMFTTLFYGVLDTRSGGLAYASAGHNPPYWRQSATGHLVRLALRGIALGVVEDPHFENGCVVLGPGDALVLYTDGVTDAFDTAGQAFGEAGLCEAIRKAGTRPAEQLVQAINQAVQEFVNGAPQYDDYTLVVVARDLEAPPA
mgnify:FL=1